MELEKSLINWSFEEDRHEYLQNREKLWIVLGVTGTIFSLLIETYIFAVIVFTATFVFVKLARREKRVIDFAIREYCIHVDGEDIPFEKITGYNIVDEIGERSRLILRTFDIIQQNEVVPIYDVDTEKISSILDSFKITRDEKIKISIIDRIARYI